MPLDIPAEYFPLFDQRFVDLLKKTGAIRSALVEAALRARPRRLFVPFAPLDEVYRDESITTHMHDGVAVSSNSQPSVVAAMLELLALEPGMRVLEIGAGSGWNAALLRHIVGEQGRVVAVDIDPDVAAGAVRNLEAAGVNGVQVLCGDGALGHPPGAPYDRIILTVGARDIAPAWREQLRARGRLVMPLAPRGIVPQPLVVFEKHGACLTSLAARVSAFVMLRGSLAGAATHVPLGSGTGLTLAVDDAGSVAAAALWEALTKPSIGRATGVRATLIGIGGSLALWLAIRDEAYCLLLARSGAQAEARVPRLTGAGPAATVGLAQADGLCLLFAEAAETDDHTSAEIGVREYAGGAALSRRLIDHVRAWDSAGRPSARDLYVRACPPGPAVEAGASETIIRRESTWFIFNFVPPPPGGGTGSR